MTTGGSETQCTLSETLAYSRLERSGRQPGARLGASLTQLALYFATSADNRAGRSRGFEVSSLDCFLGLSVCLSAQSCGKCVRGDLNLKGELLLLFIRRFRLISNLIYVQRRGAEISPFDPSRQNLDDVFSVAEDCALSARSPSAARPPSHRRRHLVQKSPTKCPRHL